ncbi:hypothetical protein ACFQNF_16225 [Iodobacter arcticus]|uniref:Uncharacterized protein n=1 Tax=Iodobacter arcticus TaxID=590593 RepID=A0ABW2R0F9_9NEIS
MNKSSILAFTITFTLALSAFASAAGTVPFTEPSRPAMDNDHSANAVSPDQTASAQAKSHSKTTGITPFSQRSRPPMEAQARSEPHSPAKSTEIAPANVTPADMHPGRLKRTQYQ